jgi:Na+/proline symporter
VRLHLWGLHIVDLLILLAFLVAILVVGVRVSRGVKHEGDFYLGGRKLGRTLQFFLNFGNATDTNGAVVMASEVFRQGVGGVWLSLQTLFITPFFWFTQPWFRRARVITMADLFVDRFESKAVASAYAAFNICVALLLLGGGNRGSYEVCAAMMVKSPEQYSQADRQRVEGFHEYQHLKTISSTLDPDQTRRYEALDTLFKRGELSASVSFIKPIPFYLTYCLIVAIYIILGGLKAAAITDAVQGVLILVMSIILIPAGLVKVGGAAALHRVLPQSVFHLVGTAASSEYAWYSIAAITLGSLIQIIGLSHNMSAGGSATNEDTARFGMISGGFTKRIVLIGWMFCGLLALALLSGEHAISEPDKAWGALSKLLLGPGLMGLMLSGMLLGHMPSVGLSSVAVSGLVTRNIYEPLIPGRSEKHYLRAGQVFIAIVLALSIIIALAASGVASLMKTMITFNIFFGAVVLLTFFWRRLTASAILISLAIWVVLIGIVPLLVPAVQSLRRQASLTLRTESRVVEISAPATAEDVAAGRASAVNQTIRKIHVVAPVGCFFEQVALVDPQNPDAGYEGIGRFFTENYLLHAIGVPLQRLGPAGVVASRWLFDSLFPFVCLIVFSLITPANRSPRAAGFYAKLKTPVAPTPDQDRAEVEKSYAEPHRFDDLKLMPWTNWEFTKWTRKDFAGFFGCWGIVGVILIFLWVVLHLGA